eukprot:TRINITY_DN12660_c0_g1_i1.p1 TRINITY_DN12660_c0_g1~~TRINITY_DN12660_c0_g1_i1.p1  ORF type:complete len:202 (-),score=21.23 TRINITY_DN12660_c0_g1_i1:122-727(-)
MACQGKCFYITLGICSFFLLACVIVAGVMGGYSRNVAPLLWENGISGGGTVVTTDGLTVSGFYNSSEEYILFRYDHHKNSPAKVEANLTAVWDSEYDYVSVCVFPLNRVPGWYYLQEYGNCRGVPVNGSATNSLTACHTRDISMWVAIYSPVSANYTLSIKITESTKQEQYDEPYNGCRWVLQDGSQRFMITTTLYIVIAG